MTHSPISAVLASRLAHELRSPASVLLGTLSQLERDEGLSKTSVQLLKLARRSCTRMERLSRRLDHLAASAPQSRGPTPLASVRGWIDRAASEAARSSIVVHVEELPTQGSFSGPAVHALEVMVDELVHNAVRHARSCIHVRVDADERLLRLEVRDDGPGLPEHLRVGGDPSGSEEARNGGLGVGLGLVRRFSEAVGASLELGPNAMIVEVPR